MFLSYHCVTFATLFFFVYNYNPLFQAGANMIVSGTAVIEAADQASTIKLLRDTVQRVINKY